MSWSYSGDPAESDLDAVRFYLGDTDESRQILSDEEIQFTLDKWIPSYGSVLMAAAAAAEVAAGKFTREVSVSADGVSVQVGELQQRFNDLAMSLRDQYKAEVASGPILSGALYDDAPDMTIKPLNFGIGFTDNKRAGQQDYGSRGTWPEFPESMP